MTITSLEVFVFEERGGGEHDICVVGGVGKELLMHYGVEVVAQQSADHGVLIGSNCRGIGVVDEKRFHRR